jgi:2'-5' RNA ligase
VRARLAALGHEPEAREFHPHLTLARARAVTDFTDAVEMIDDRDTLPAWTVAEVVVFESVLRRDGAQYVPRRAIALDG